MGADQEVADLVQADLDVLIDVVGPAPLGQFVITDHGDLSTDRTPAPPPRWPDSCSSASAVLRPDVRWLARGTTTAILGLVRVKDRLE